LSNKPPEGDGESLSVPEARPDRARLLLAVDVGLRTGLAWLGADGRLRGYRATHFPDRGRLKGAARGVIGRLPGEVVAVVAEGDPRLSKVWEAAAAPVPVRVVQAVTWRRDLLAAHERRTGRRAKVRAEEVARAFIAWSGLPRPTSLRHDAAEAVCLALWAGWRAGWLELDRAP
jgi:hypothetical protein